MKLSNLKRKTFTVPNSTLIEFGPNSEVRLGVLPQALKLINEHSYDSGIFGTKTSLLSVAVRKAVADLDDTRKDILDRNIAKNDDGTPEPVFEMTHPEDGSEPQQVVKPGVLRIKDNQAFAKEMNALMAMDSEIRAIPFTLEELCDVPGVPALKEALEPFIVFDDDEET